MAFNVNCGTSQCLYYILLVFVGVIVATLMLDVLLYFGYSYFVVRRYYSSDLDKWRKRELSKFGSGGGYIGQKWEEVYPPDEEMKMSYLTANTDTLFGLDAGEIYTCKKPCNGTSDDTFWSKISAPAKISKLSASDGALWAITVDGTPMSFKDGKWTDAFKGVFTNISADGTWAVKNNDPYKCNDEDCIISQIPTTTVQQVVNGQHVAWALTNGGELYYNYLASDKEKWTKVKGIKGKDVKYVTVGLADEVYVITEDNELYASEDATQEDPNWSKIPNAPKFISLAVNKDIYAIDVNGQMWRGT